VDAGLLGQGFPNVEDVLFITICVPMGNPSYNSGSGLFGYEMSGRTHAPLWTDFPQTGGGDLYGVWQWNMGDMCVHCFDTVRWMLELDWAQNELSSNRMESMLQKRW